VNVGDLLVMVYSSTFTGKLLTVTFKRKQRCK